MFDSLFNVLIVLIPLAIFIGRAIVGARSKHAPPPRIPVHFEDDDDEEEPGYFKGKEPVYDSKVSGAKTHSQVYRQRVSPSSVITAALTPEDAPPALSPKTVPARRAAGAGMVSPVQQGLPLNLNHLSPMKQAVVMAEILGPPKALS